MPVQDGDLNENIHGQVQYRGVFRLEARLTVVRTQGGTSRSWGQTIAKIYFVEAHKKTLMQGTYHHYWLPATNTLKKTYGTAQMVIFSVGSVASSMEGVTHRISKSCAEKLGTAMIASNGYNNQQQW